MEPQRSRRWNRRRAEILAAAEQLFGERGYAATRLDDVADRLDMRRPSLLYYFADKEALYDAVFESIFVHFWSRIATAREAEHPLERIDAISSAWIDCLRERPDAARIILRQIVDVLPARGARVQERLSAILDAIRDEIDAGVEAGIFKPMDAGVYATTIAGASMVWVAAQPVVERSFGIDPLTAEALEDFRGVLSQLARRMLGATSNEAGADTDAREGSIDGPAPRRS